MGDSRPSFPRSRALLPLPPTLKYYPALRACGRKNAHLLFYVAKTLQAAGMIAVGASVYLGFARGQAPDVPAFVIGLVSFYGGRLAERYAGR